MTAPHDTSGARGQATGGGDGRRREARRRLAPDRLARAQRQRRTSARRRASASGRDAPSSTTARTRSRAPSSPAGHARSASSASTRRCTAPRPRCSGSRRPRTPPATSSPSSACASLDRASVHQRDRAPPGPGRRRDPRHRAAGVGAVEAILNLRADVPVVAVEAGPDDDGPGGRGRPGRPAPRAATEHLLDLGHRTVWHIAGPRDWLEAQRPRRRLARRRSTTAGADDPAGAQGDWSARSGYEVARRLPPTRTSPRCSSPTTRWRSACCARCTSRPADPGRRQRRRLRRHPRGGVLHPAADHGAPGLRGDGPARAAVLLRDERLDGGSRARGASRSRRSWSCARAPARLRR